MQAGAGGRRVGMWVLTFGAQAGPLPHPTNCCLTTPSSAPPHSPSPQLAEEEEFEAKRKELEEVASPVFAKLYQQGGGAPGGMPDMGGMPGGGPATGPTVEEVDCEYIFTSFT